MSIRSSRHNTGDPKHGFVAHRDGDAIRVDEYLGRKKVKNIAYYLDATTWPDERQDRLNMAVFMLRNPTLLKGRSLIGEKPSFWDGDSLRAGEAIARAIDEVLEAT